MRLWATTLAGAEITLPPPVSLRCSLAYDTPADGLEAVFPAAGALGTEELATVAMELDGNTVFDGLVDEQALLKSAGGSFLTLRARGQAALLLDNEAIPQTFYRANLWDIYNAHCRQYGFAGILYDRNPTLYSFTVAKGQSEWQALESFCRQTLGLRPFVRDGWVVARHRPEGRQLLLSNTAAGGLRFSSLAVRNKRYGVISKVILKSAARLYDTAVYHPCFAALDIRRKRYIAPPKDWCDSPRNGADRLMRDSTLKKLLVTALLPGLWAAQPGDRAVIDDGAAAGLGGLVVFEAVYKADAAGYFTELTMVLPDYL